MKVCLATRHAKKSFMPLALLYLKASLAQRDAIDASQIVISEFEKETTGEAIAEAVLATKPDVVGLSCYVWNVVALMRAAHFIKQARPQIRIVIGGPEVGPVAEATLSRHPCIDTVVRAEGEIPFSELVMCWQAGRSLEEVAGITYRDGDRIIANADSAIVRDINLLASPHRLEDIAHTDRIICLETQRGCVFRCNFCFYNKDYSIRNRRFDLDRVKQEIAFWLERDIRQIYLMDPVFNLNSARAKEICRFIADHNHRGVQVHTEVWAEFIDDEMAELFKKANFKFIEVGLQTTDSEVLGIAERRLKLQPFLDGIGYLNKHNLNYELQLIAGLPGETVETFRTSLDFAAGLGPPQLAVFDLMILPGTELWRKAEALKVEFDPEPPYLVRSHQSMNRSEIKQVSDLARTATRLWKFLSLRLLWRAKAGGAFSTMVDDWNDWHPGPPATSQVSERLPDFIHYFAGRHGIDPQFFLQIAATELE